MHANELSQTVECGATAPFVINAQSAQFIMKMLRSCPERLYRDFESVQRSFLRDIRAILRHLLATAQIQTKPSLASLVPRPSSALEERGRVWNITPGGSVPKECCAQVIMTRNLIYVVSHAYKECKLRSILLKCARVRPVHAARLGTFCSPFECIVVNTLYCGQSTPIAEFLPSGHFRPGLCSRPSLSLLAHWRVWDETIPWPL